MLFDIQHVLEDKSRDRNNLFNAANVCIVSCRLHYVHWSIDWKVCASLLRIC
uniref:Uncharacterized protein n=1 Tax=Manihot esculenta TaxID=3983 RepID=A0A199UA50_MANES